jgi:deoxyadenosine/deoxycytidine kinase
MSSFYRKPTIISIEGNIGTGKSTILANLKIRMDDVMPGNRILFLKEPVDIWESIKDEHGHTILEKFYKDQKRYAFTFQVMAYISRLSLLKRAIKENPECETIIIERSLIADKNIFMQMLYDDGQVEMMEFEIYNRWYREFIEEYRVDSIVYLDSDPEICSERINRRNRNGEEGIPLSYLRKCRDYHQRWLVDTKINNSDKEISEHAESYKINHDGYDYSVLRINSNSNVEYPDSLSNEWLKGIQQFIEDLRTKQ